MMRTSQTKPRIQEEKLYLTMIWARFWTSDTSDVRPNSDVRHLATATAAYLYRRTSTEDGLPTKFGRPTCRTSETRRTSERCGCRTRTSNPGHLTPESDFRPVSDVRPDGRPKHIGRSKLPARRSDGLRPLYPPSL